MTAQALADLGEQPVLETALHLQENILFQSLPCLLLFENTLGQELPKEAFGTVPSE